MNSFSRPNPLAAAPARDAPWPAWRQWVADLVRVLGAYEHALPLGQLLTATAGLAVLEDRLRWETWERVRQRQEPDQARRMHRDHLFSSSRRRLDEARLLVGTLARRSSLGEAPVVQAGVAYPDRLRQRAKRAVEQLLEQLEPLAQTETEGGNPQ